MAIRVFWIESNCKMDDFLFVLIYLMKYIRDGNCETWRVIYYSFGITNCIRMPSPKCMYRLEHLLDGASHLFKCLDAFKSRSKWLIEGCNAPPPPSSFIIHRPSQWLQMNFELKKWEKKTPLVGALEYFMLFEV